MIGVLYFPDVSFIPFLRSIDEVVKGIMNKSRFEQDGSDIIKSSHNQILSYQVLLLQVAHEKVKEQADLKSSFLKILEERLPNINTISKDSLENVFTVFTRKICNTRIQEFISSMKQQMASKKRLGTTVDVNVNLRPILLAHHTKLESKLT